MHNCSNHSSLPHRRTTRPDPIALARRNLSRFPAARPRERHVTRARGDHRRCGRLRAVRPHSSNAAIAASARLCRRAELGHPLTGAVPWQTERQPQLAAAGAALTRAVAARLAEAERLLADRHGYRGLTGVDIREPYDHARVATEGYPVP